MFNRKINNDELTDLEKAITYLLTEMDGDDTTTEVYSRQSQALRTLMEARKIDNETHKLDAEALKIEAEAAKVLAEAEKIKAEARELESKNDHPWRPSPEVIMSVAGSLAGIIAILSYEKANVLTSKAVTFIPKIMR